MNSKMVKLILADGTEKEIEEDKLNSLSIPQLMKLTKSRMIINIIYK